MIHRSGIALVLAATMAAGFAAPSSARSAGCDGGPALETFEVRTKWNKKVYSPGETIKVDITVLRPAGKDPFDLGVRFEPPHQTPVEDAKVTVAFTVGVPPVFGIGYTDADGRLHLDIPFKSKVRGPIDSTTRASKVYNENGPDCTNPEEWGRKFESPAFVVREG